MWWNNLWSHTPVLYLTQPLWRDEAFSVLLARHAPHEIVMLTTQDFTPPLYYVLLSLWMYMFGSGEVAVRMLSFVTYIVLLRGCYLLAREIRHKLPACFPAIVTFFIAINPMIVYYAFEARAYMLAICLGIWAVLWYVRKTWTLFITASVLMLYTHPYTIFLLLAMGMSTLMTKDKKQIARLLKHAAVILALYIPWMVAVYFQIARKEDMWFYPVDLKLVMAILSNMYTGFEGTPPHFWAASNYISAAIAGVIILGFPWRLVRRPTLTLFFLWMLVPLVIVVGISFYRPVFVARYVLYVTIAEIFLMVISILHVRFRYVQYALIASIGMSTLWFNWWYAPYHAKADFRTTFEVVNALYDPGDIIISETALAFFESVYYAKESEQVYLYHPSGTRLPSYVGAVLIPGDRFLRSIPTDRTVFLIHENGTYTMYL